MLTTTPQSLIIPFAFLIHNQRDTVLTLLEGTNVAGRSGLDILIQTWCENAETFQGFWPTRISALALSSLFASERPSLQQLIVKGDIIVKPETKNGECLLLCLCGCCWAVGAERACVRSDHDALEDEAKYALLGSGAGLYRTIYAMTDTR